MPPTTMRPVNTRVAIIDCPPRLTAAQRADLLAAACTTDGKPALVLNLSAVVDMDGGGLAALMELAAVTRRRKQPVLAFGLSRTLRGVVELVRLNDAVDIYANEQAALAAAGAGGAPSATPQAARVTEAPAGEWAPYVARLSAPPAPSAVVNLNVDGRRPLSPLDGFGRMVRKTYSIRLTGSTASPADVIAAWRAEFAGFWPSGNAYAPADRAIKAGDVGLLNLTLMGPVKLYTGVLVIYAGDRSFCFMTPQGHMFGGLINFSAHDDGGVTVVSVEPTIRASDPLYELTLRAGVGAVMEDRFWRQTLANLARRFGAHDTPQMTTERIDGAVQWSAAGNIWHNAAVRSTLHMLAAPLRWLRR